MPRLPQSHTF